MIALFLSATLMLQEAARAEALGSKGLAVPSGPAIELDGRIGSWGRLELQQAAVPAAAPK